MRRTEVFPQCFAGCIEHHSAVFALVEVCLDVPIHARHKFAVEVFANQADCFLASHSRRPGVVARHAPPNTLIPHAVYQTDLLACAIVKCLS